MMEIKKEVELTLQLWSLLCSASMHSNNPVKSHTSDVAVYVLTFMLKLSIEPWQM
jgi:hypothetical protein